MLEVLDPTRTSLELVLRDPEGLGDVPGLVADQRIRKRDILGDRSRRQPFDELSLDLWELGRSKPRENQ